LLRTSLLTGALALTACGDPGVARADVLQVDAAGAYWIAGGPAAPAPDDAQEVQRSFTGIGDSAGPARFRSRVAELARKYDISPSLLEAVVWQESRWNVAALSSVGAQGLAQLMPGTARQMGIDARDPMANLEGGARYLRMQLDAFNGDVERALAAYNAGPVRVQRAGGVPPIRETRQYVAAIMARLSDPVRR